ncbi:bacteriorhodopsin [Natronolimnohabitans innermongolicus]|uniref:Rhodopsin n=1 Tax=Natronolimnohabitans innermongolicus JCM 12255 TaxID=1227499 RepID=L9WY63_9EURY|nr:bacteriorhodopsin [Natronolimnohabitans innermongolicus]ELY53303.1 rhodopsin [Natronolimnohabitans innermongolicus JCM 12255]
MESVLLASGVTFSLVTILALVGTLQLSARTRLYGYAAVAACGSMAIAYVAMVPAEMAGIETDYLRFVGYGAMWAGICLLVGAVSGAGRTLTLVLLGIVQARVWVTLLSWHVEGVLGTLLAAFPFVMLIAGVYVLFGPFARAAATVSSTRRLLYAKLRNLIVLVWLGLVALGLLSGAEFALTDDFLEQLSIIYVEAILLVGFAGIVLRSTDALEDTAASRSTALDAESDSSGDVDAAVNAAD